MVSDRTYYFKEGETRKNTIAKLFRDAMIKYNFTTYDKPITDFILKGNIQRAYDTFNVLWFKVEGLYQPYGEIIGYLCYHNREEFGNSVILDMFKRIYGVNASLHQIKTDNYSASRDVKELNAKDLTKGYYGYNSKGERRKARLQIYIKRENNKSKLFKRYVDAQTGEKLKRTK